MTPDAAEVTATAGAAGVAAAMWLARRPTRGRWALALVAGACLLPAAGNDDWHTRLSDTPRMSPISRSVRFLT